MKDMEEWVQARAELIAQELYDKDFYELSDEAQIEVWEQAEADWADYYAGMIDAACDKYREEWMIGDR